MTGSTSDGLGWISATAIISNVLLWLIEAWRRLENRLLDSRLEVLETKMASKLDHAAVVAIAREFAKEIREDLRQKHLDSQHPINETNERVKRIEDILLERHFRGGSMP